MHIGQLAMKRPPNLLLEASFNTYSVFWVAGKEDGEPVKDSFMKILQVSRK